MQLLVAGFTGGVGGGGEPGAGLAAAAEVVQHDRGHARHLPGGAAQPYPGGDRLRDVQQWADVGEVGDQVGQDPGGGLAVVAVAFSGGFQVGQVGRVGGESLVEGCAGVAQGGERRTGQAGGQRAAQQLAALHRIISIRWLCAGGDGGVLPGSPSKPQRGTGNPKTVRDPLHRVEAGHRSVTSGHFADPLGFHSAGFGDPVETDLRPVGHGEDDGEVPDLQGPQERRVGQQPAGQLCR
ncbi:hypothetical protein ACFXPY_48280 [Streptomyces sp. NPDC059153]|uniref:hypothetical protein n=1 Tax=Streptomyces sp. NPDC059153 TaxID=3346743 RepID=UPI0036B16D20